MESGKQMRLDILKKDAIHSIMNPFQKHNWQCNIIGSFPNGEYLLIHIEKGGVKFKLALLYSCATSNTIYKELDKIVDLIVLNSEFYHLESYAYGIKTDVIEKNNIQKYIIKWNTIASNGKISLGGIDNPIIKTKEFNSHIQSEQPIEQIWSRIRQFRTKGLAKKLVELRCINDGKEIDDEILQMKSEGLSFCIQNSCDYFETASKQLLNQRIISLYYGAISFASAEMLASPYGPTSLKQVEEMTKYGHGLYTFDSLEDNDFEGFVVGVLSHGFFKNWIDFLGFDVKNFPKSKPKKTEDINFSSDYVTTLIELFSHIPELEDLFIMVSNKSINWLIFNYDNDGNNYNVFNGSKSRDTYVTITDISCSKTVDDIAKLDLPIEQIELTNSEYPGLHFKALVRHPDHDYWFEVIDQHHSPFTSTSYLLPIFHDIGKYRCITTVILYALSILSRYRPSIWREVISGKNDNYLALIEEFLTVYERIAPELFLEVLLDKKISVTQPGTFNAVI